MKIYQLAIFLENKPGRLVKLCNVLAQAGINILGFSLADTQQFGILRLLVDDPQRAHKILENSGFYCKYQRSSS